MPKLILDDCPKYSFISESKVGLGRDSIEIFSLLTYEYEILLLITLLTSDPNSIIF